MLIPVGDLAKIQTWRLRYLDMASRSVVEVYLLFIPPCWVHFNLIKKTTESVTVLVLVYQSARRHIPEDNSRENIRAHKQ